MFLQCTSCALANMILVGQPIWPPATYLQFSYNQSLFGYSIAILLLHLHQDMDCFRNLVKMFPLRTVLVPKQKRLRSAIQYDHNLFDLEISEVSAS